MCVLLMSVCLLSSVLAFYIEPTADTTAPDIMLLGQAAETQCPEIIHRQSTCLQLELDLCSLHFHVLSDVSVLAKCYPLVHREFNIKTTGCLKGKGEVLLKVWSPFLDYLPVDLKNILWCGRPFIVLIIEHTA